MIPPPGSTNVGAPSPPLVADPYTLGLSPPFQDGEADQGPNEVLGGVAMLGVAGAVLGYPVADLAYGLMSDVPTDLEGALYSDFYMGTNVTDSLPMDTYEVLFDAAQVVEEGVDVLAEADAALEAAVAGDAAWEIALEVAAMFLL